MSSDRLDAPAWLLRPKAEPVGDESAAACRGWRDLQLAVLQLLLHLLDPVVEVVLQRPRHRLVQVDRAGQRLLVRGGGDAVVGRALVEVRRGDIGCGVTAQAESAIAESAIAGGETVVFSGGPHWKQAGEARGVGLGGGVGGLKCGVRAALHAPRVASFRSSSTSPVGPWTRIGVDETVAVGAGDADDEVELVHVRGALDDREAAAVDA